MSCTVCHSWLCKCGPHFTFTVKLTEEERAALRAGALVLRAAAIEHRAMVPHAALRTAEALGQVKQANAAAEDKERHAKVLDALAERFSES